MTSLTRSSRSHKSTLLHRGDTTPWSTTSWLVGRLALVGRVGGGGEGVSSTSIDRSRDKTSNTFIGSLASDCGLPQQGPEHESGLCCETHSCSS